MGVAEENVEAVTGLLKKIADRDGMEYAGLVQGMAMLKAAVEMERPKLSEKGLDAISHGVATLAATALKLAGREGKGPKFAKDVMEVLEEAIVVLKDEEKVH